MSYHLWLFIDFIGICCGVLLLDLPLDQSFGVAVLALVLYNGPTGAYK